MNRAAEATEVFAFRRTYRMPDKQTPVFFLLST
jgi:hypothetical protein